MGWTRSPAPERIVPVKLSPSSLAPFGPTKACPHQPVVSGPSSWGCGPLRCKAAPTHKRGNRAQHHMHAHTHCPASRQANRPTALPPHHSPPVGAQDLCQAAQSSDSATPKTRIWLSYLVSFRVFRKISDLSRTKHPSPGFETWI